MYTEQVTSLKILDFSCNGTFAKNTPFVFSKQSRLCRAGEKTTELDRCLDRFLFHLTCWPCLARTRLLGLKALCVVCWSLRHCVLSMYLYGR